MQLRFQCFPPPPPIHPNVNVFVIPLRLLRISRLVFEYLQVYWKNVEALERVIVQSHAAEWAAVPGVHGVLDKIGNDDFIWALVNWTFSYSV